MPAPTASFFPEAEKASAEMGAVARRSTVSVSLSSVPESVYMCTSLSSPPTATVEPCAAIEVGEYLTDNEPTLSPLEYIAIASADRINTVLDVAATPLG